MLPSQLYSSKRSGVALWPAKGHILARGINLCNQRASIKRPARQRCEAGGSLDLATAAAFNAKSVSGHRAPTSDTESLGPRQYRPCKGIVRALEYICYYSGVVSTIPMSDVV